VSCSHADVVAALKHQNRQRLTVMGTTPSTKQLQRGDRDGGLVLSKPRNRCQRFNCMDADTHPLAAVLSHRKLAVPRSYVGYNVRCFAVDDFCRLGARALLPYV
jgi:hypothetical protein